MEKKQENKNIKRQVAKKTKIKDITLGQYIKEEGWNPNFILTNNNNKISRVNIIGIIVNKSEQDNNTITLDDSEASINIRSFDNAKAFDELQVGDVVQIIGRPREFNSEKYLISEIIKKIDKKWLEVRRLELEMNKDDETEEPIKDEEVIVDEVMISDDFEKALEKIRKEDKGEGVSTADIISNGIPEETINKLLENGEIFEISPGKLKILE